MDWFFITQPGLGKLCGFALILSYSRYLFAHLFPRSSFEFFIEGHLMAFSSMGGTAHSLRYDNLKSVVIKRRPQIQYNPRFLDFSRHYGIDIRLCNPGAGNEKGRVERAIRTLKESFFHPLSNYSSLKTLNEAMKQWVARKNHTIHRATGKKPVEMLKEEKLKPLPQIPYRNVSIHPPVKTTKTAMMLFDTNAYSVPEYLVGKRLSMHATPTTVNIYEEDKKVASHPRAFQRHQKIINPLHRSYSRLSAKAKMQRIHEAVKNLHPAMAEMLMKNQHCGEDPQKTAYELFKLLRQYSRAMLISAVSECVRKKSPRLKTLLSYLNQKPQTYETVQPQNAELLNITYTARALDEYDES